MTPSTYNVLFICTGNSARSIMAEAIEVPVMLSLVALVNAWRPATDTAPA